MDETALRKAVVEGFEYSYIHEDWVTPLEEALEGLTPEQALWRANPASTCIWEILLHLTVWTDNIVYRIEQNGPDHPIEGAWPTLPNPANQETLQQTQERLWQSLDRLKVLVETTSFQQIEASRYGLGDLLCRFTHNGYHIGQIVKMRECMEANG
jgi:hypothetical protein